MKHARLENSILKPDLLGAKSINAASVCINTTRNFTNISKETTACRQYERKMYTTVLLIALCIAIPPLVFVAAYMYFSAEEELGVSVSQYEKQRKKKATEVRQASSQK